MANAKAKELFSDKDFLAELGKTKSAEEAQKLIASKGGEISIEELKAIQNATKGGELNDEALEGVAGGSWTWLTVVSHGIKTFALNW